MGLEETSKEGVRNAITAVPDTFHGRAVTQVATGRTRRSSRAGEISRAVEDVAVARRGLVAFHGRVHEGQGGVIGVNPSTFAVHGAVRLVAVDGGILHVHRAVEGINPAAVGIRAVGLVGVDRAVGKGGGTGQDRQAAAPGVAAAGARTAGAADGLILVEGAVVERQRGIVGGTEKEVAGADVDAAAHAGSRHWHRRRRRRRWPGFD